MIDRNELRALVREVVREAVAGLSAAPKTPGTAVELSAPPTVAVPPPPAPAPSTVADQLGVSPTGPLAADGRSRTETVRLTNDKDLDAFIRKLLQLFENPKNRADLKAGRLSFRLAGTTTANATHRIDSGAVTERHIADMAGGTLMLGRRAVLTPLAREKARAMGITIQKERT